MVWDWIIASYLFLAGMGAGAFALAALASFVKPELKKLRMVGYVIAPVAVVVGCVMLMVDAKGEPVRPAALLLHRVEPAIGDVVGCHHLVPVHLGERGCVGGHAEEGLHAQGA